ncbi:MULTISPECIES: FxLYD domain-containing protein [Streptomyces]|uniref:FxLYD domain-containing protein n=1 Tax=Streptomyces TaxID=1883 RepID=UPI0029A419C2|nr:FxLYD domain-containing protein [Streptomyces sp. ID05-18]MDX3483847.1 FxLYD domain-containing protein [Streptomyces sp. ID05-18]
MSDYFPPPPPEQPQPEHRAPVGASPPSPWAAPAAPPGKQRTGLIVTLAVGGGLVVAGAMVALVYSLMDSVSDSIALPPERSDAPYSEPYGEEPYDEEPYDEEPVEPVAPGPAAEGDVTVTTCTRDSLIGWPHADLKIVNRSGSPAAYIVSITFVNADGAVVSDGIATTEKVAPGASVKVRAQGSGEVAAGTKCRIAGVDRHAL